MKQIVKPLVLLFCLAGLASCTKKVEDVPVDPVIVNPIADYTLVPDPTDGFTFKYNNLSKNYTKLEWRFGDDTLKTDASPTHTFLTTGKYTTDLKTFSSTGSFSHKYTDISILPDDIIQFDAVKTGVTNPANNEVELQFIAKVKANVVKYEWTFNDTRDFKQTVTTKSNLASPKISFQKSSFNNFTLKITTDKGSTATLGKSVTVDGIATNFTQSYINNVPLYPAAIANFDNTDQGANEGASKLVDGNPLTKFGYYKSFPTTSPINGQLIITLQFAQAQTAKIYGFMNGNDSGSGRDPKEWYIEGANSKDGPWTVLDHQLLTVGFYDGFTALGLSGKGPAELGNIDVRYRKTTYYPLSTTGAYTFYRWRCTQTFGGAFQMSELAFYK